MKSDMHYKGLDSYTVSSRTFGGKSVLIFIILIISIGATLFIRLKNSDVYEDIEKNMMSADDIKYYIDFCDSESSGKAQLNWQEVAAIWINYESGQVDFNYNLTIEKLCNLFLSENGNGEYKVKSFDEVLGIIGLSSKNKKIINKYLHSIENNAIYSELYAERDKTSFIKLIAKEAIKNYKEYKILPSITISQAILESGWGQSELAVSNKNLFGIKADSRWDGAIVTIVTSENYNDTTEANFRKYESVSESINDHGKFLYENIRYTTNGLFKGKDYIAQAQALENAGYSTAKNEKGEPIYADKLIGVIQKYNLMLYDTEAQRVKS